MDERPASRGSTRANTVFDFDWYGNTNQINHLVKGSRKEKNVQMVGFETQLRAYAQVTKFKAPHPWEYHGEEKSLDRV